VTRRVLILGGAGAVGMRIARLVAELSDVELLIAGRDFGRTTQFSDELCESGVSARPVGADNLVGLLGLERPALVIDASGPFRGRDLAVPRACIAAHIPYIDLAGDADFSIAVRKLNQAAIAAGVAVISGACISPCVTLAAVEAIASSLTRVEAVRIVLCPGNQHPFGAASYLSLLSRTGRPFRIRQAGAWRTAHVWQGLRSAILPEIGARAVCAIETADIPLLVERWPDLRDVSVQAGTEIGALQRALWLLSWVARLGVNLARLSGLLEGLSRTIGYIGSHRFVLRVAVVGRNGGDLVERSWTLLAEDGGLLAATPAMALARRILLGPPLPPGARVATLTLAEIRAELLKTGFDVRMNETVV
jgi:hypothetical protein